MGFIQFWRERSAGGKDATIALLGGAVAIIFAFFFGAEDQIAFAFGLTVTLALAVVAFLAWVRSKWICRQQ